MKTKKELSDFYSNATEKEYRKLVDEVMQGAKNELLFQLVEDKSIKFQERNGLKPNTVFCPINLDLYGLEDLTIAGLKVEFYMAQMPEFIFVAHIVS